MLNLKSRDRFVVQTHSAGVMHNGEVSLLLTRLGRLGLLEVGMLAQMLSPQLLSEGLISSLGEHRLLLKDGEDTQGLLRDIIARLDIATATRAQKIGPQAKFRAQEFFGFHSMFKSSQA